MWPVTVTAGYQHWTAVTLHRPTHSHGASYAGHASTGQLHYYIKSFLWGKFAFLECMSFTSKWSISVCWCFSPIICGFAGSWQSFQNCYFRSNCSRGRLNPFELQLSLLSSLSLNQPHREPSKWTHSEPHFVKNLLPTARIAMFVRPLVRSSRFLPHLTHTIVWCVSVSNGMKVDKVTDEVAN